MKNRVILSVATCLVVFPGWLLAANLMLINCYEPWQKPESVHACVMDVDSVVELGDYQEVDFETLGQQQHFSCKTHACRVVVGVGYCSADSYGVKSGEYDAVEAGWYIIELKSEHLELNPGRSCPD